MSQEPKATTSFGSISMKSNSNTKFSRIFVGIFFLIIGILNIILGVYILVVHETPMPDRSKFVLTVWCGGAFLTALGLRALKNVKKKGMEERKTKTNKNRRLEKTSGLAFGLVAAIVQIIYWIRAVEVSRHAGIYKGDKEPYWNNGGPGSFFPWPKEPGMLTVITGMDSTDQFIYYLIHYRLFPFVALIIVVIFVLLGRLIGRGINTLAEKHLLIGLNTKINPPSHQEVRKNERSKNE